MKPKHHDRPLVARLQHWSASHQKVPNQKVKICVKYISFPKEVSVILCSSDHSDCVIVLILVCFSFFETIKHGE